MAKRKGKKPQRSKGYGSQKGWHGESARHSLASRGIATAPEEVSKGGINITVVGMDSSTQSTPGRLTGLPVRPTIPGQPQPDIAPVISFAEDQAIEDEINTMQDEVDGLESRMKIDKINIAGLKDERKAMQKIHRTERDEYMTKLMGRKPGWFSSYRDLTPEKQRKFKDFEVKQRKKEAELEGRIKSLETSYSTHKATFKAKRSDISRRKDYLEDIKEMREKEQRKRVETLEQTRTLNRVIREGQR